MIQCWVLILAAYEYTVVCHQTKQHENADAMSQVGQFSQHLQSLRNFALLVVPTLCLSRYSLKHQDF